MTFFYNEYYGYRHLLMCHKQKYSVSHPKGQTTEHFFIILFTGSVLMLLDISNYIAYSLDVLSICIGDIDAEFVLDSLYKINYIK